MAGSIFLCVVVYQQVGKKPDVSKTYTNNKQLADCPSGQLSLPRGSHIEKVDISPPYLLLSVKEEGRVSLVVVDYCDNKVLKTIKVIEHN